jgi:D-glycero-alpha-D-manno-heptose-7-phosphate kinase
LIIVQTPLRISLFGGGTDFPSFFLKEGGCVLSTAIDKYIFVTIKKRFDDKLRVGYTSTEMVDRVDDIKHELIREAFKLAGISKGVEVNTTGDIPAGTGLGSSSTVTVGVLNAMFTYLNIPVHPEQLAQLACQIEIETLQKPIGYQDQYIAAYGGFRLIEFGKDGKTNTQVIKLSSESENRLSDNLLLFYTGVRRQAETILAEQKQNISDHSSILKSLKQMAYAAVEELQKGDIDCIGHMLHESWQLKKQLASGISNDTINEYYEKAIQAGALGGKLTGAGGGGFLLVYAPYEKRTPIRESLRELREIPINLEPSGSKVIFDYRRS